MQSQIPAERAADAAWLSAQVAAFSGEITCLPGPTFEPPPMRKHPESDPLFVAPPRTDHLTKLEKRRREHGPDIVKRFNAGDKISEISEAKGLGRDFVRDYLQSLGVDTGINRHKGSSVAVDVVERLREMAENRYSGRYAAQVLGISHFRARTIADAHGFKFSAPSKGRG